MNGSLAHSVVTVGEGAVLGGTGTVGGLVARPGAAVAPGNSIGTLDVAANTSFAPGSTFRVEADAAGRSEAGLDVRVGRGTTLGVSYTGQVGERAQDHAVKGNFTYRF